MKQSDFIYINVNGTCVNLTVEEVKLFKELFIRSAIREHYKN